MEWERLTNDEIEQLLGRVERKVSEARALELEALDELDRRQVYTADGCRNLSEWASQRLDVSHRTAASLVRTMRRTIDRPWLREALASGGVSFDRAEALSRLSEDDEGFHDRLDVAGVRRLAADRIEMTRDQELDSSKAQFLVMQPSLDEGWWKLWGGLDGVVGAVIDRALTEKADALPDLPDGTRGTATWRRAIALYELASGGESPQVQVTVFVDAEKATASDGRAGVRPQAGPRVGARALEAILCDTVSEVTVNTADGVPLAYGRNQYQIPPRLRRAILARTGGHCAIDGCNSPYRVEVHHIAPYSQGGTTDPDNLTALCWFHHHIAVHQHGFHPYVHETGRIRLRTPPGGERPEAKTAILARARPQG